MKNKKEFMSRFMKIKTALLEQIERKELLPADKVESENQLAESFGVSRMTARRALSELVTEGVLVRSQGIGTFVAENNRVSPVLDLPNIDEKIMQQGGEYTNSILGQAELKASRQHSQWMGVAEGALLFNLKVVHKDKGVAMQLEDVLVNPALVPDFNLQSFENKNSHHYLDQVAPFSQIEHCVEAALPSPKLASVLEIPENQACLKICRKVYSKLGVVSYARLYHAGNRFCIGTSFD